MRKRIALGAAGLAAAVAAPLAVMAVLPDRQAASAPPADSALTVPGRGATAPFTEYEAELAATDGHRLKPSRTAGTLAAEGSGRSAVTLDPGQYVEFALVTPANAVTVRYSVPDSLDGKPYTVPLRVAVDGTPGEDLTLTNRYAHLYGAQPGANDPAGGSPRRFYDDVRTMFGRTLPAGARIRLTASTAPTTIDLADFEQAPDALAPPPGALSVADFDADPTGETDSAAAFEHGIATAREEHRPLWLPPGTYTVNTQLALDQVTVQGAGPWWTVVRGAGVGFTAAEGAGGVVLRDFAVMGEATGPDAGADAISGALGGDSAISGMWLQHTRAGISLTGPLDGVTATGNRILDQFAAGVSLAAGVSRATVSQTFVRTTGGDGIAVSGASGVVVEHSTVVLPMAGSNIAVHAGRDVRVADNVVSDTQTQGAGIEIANRDGATSGSITLVRNTTLRAGSREPGQPWGVGALRLDAHDAPLTARITVSQLDLIDSSYEAVQTVEGTSVGDLELTDVTIDGAGTYAFQFQTGGSAVFTRVTAAHLGAARPIWSCLAPPFTVIQHDGNSGWYSDQPYCGDWPAPVYTYPASTGTDTAPPKVAALPPVAQAPSFDPRVMDHLPASTTPAKPTTKPTTKPGAPAGRPTGGSPARTSTPAAPRQPGPSVNLVAGHTVTASAYTEVYVGRNIGDGNPSTYWEGPADSFPQTVQVDLGAVRTVKRLVLRLPPVADWNRRTQTIAVQGSTTGSTFSTVKAAAGYLFDARTGNTVTISVTAKTRWIRLVFTANSGWKAAQLSELAAYTG